MATVGFADLVRLIEINGLLTDRETAQLKQNIDKAIDPKKLLRKLLETNKITRWQAQQLIQGNERLKIGKMLLVEELSNTSLGTLYRARQTGLDRDVTLVQLHDQFHEDEKKVSDFGRRIGNFSNVHHGSLIRPLEVLQEDQTMVMAMDDFQGESLFERVKQQGALSKQDAVKIMQQMCGLLAAIHEQNQAHGELTPSSIILDENLDAKLLCFDPTPAEEIATAEQQEYFNAKNGQASTTDDLFSLGRIGLFMLSGEFPDADYIAKNKSPLVNLFAKMSTPGTGQLTSIERIKQLLDKWVELNTEAEPSDDGGIGLSTDDYQSDGGPVSLNFGAVDFAQERIRARLKNREAPVTKDSSGEDPAAESQSSKFPVLLVSLIGGSLAGVLLCAAAIAIYFLYFAGGSETSTAIADATSNSDVNDPGNDAAEDATNKVVDVEPKSNLVDSPLMVKAEEEPTADPDAEANKNSTPPAEGTENKTDVEPAIPAVADPPIDPVMADPPKPADPPENKQDDDKEKKANNPPKVVENPFGLPKILAIPELGSSAKPAAGYDKPTELGKIKLHPGEFFAIDLHGGRQAYQESAEFQLKEIAGNERSWQVRLIPNTKVETSYETIGEFKITNDQLVYQWNETALKTPGAKSFINCILSFKTGTELAFAAMRQPVQMPPILLDERNLNGRTEIKLDDLPELSFVKVQVTPPADFPKFSYKGPGDIPADKGETNLVFGDPTHEYLVITLETRGRSKLMISAESLVLLKHGDQKYGGRKKFDEWVALGKQQGDFYSGALEEIKKLPRDQQEKSRVQRDRAQLEVNYYTEDNLRLAGLQTALDKLEGKELPVRIYFQAGDYQVDLATPDGKAYEPPAKEEQQPAK